MADEKVDSKLEEIPLKEETKAEAQDLENGQQSGKLEEEVVLKKKNRKDVFKEVRKLQKEQTRISNLIYDSIYGIIGLCFANIIHIICISIGSVYIRDCSLSPGVPIILVVNGTINLSIGLLETIKIKLRKQQGLIKTIDVFLYILKVALFGAFMAWIIIVFKVECPNYHDIYADNYCHKTVYKSAYWLLVISIFVSLFTCCCSCCCGLFSLFGGCASSDVIHEKTSKPVDTEKEKEVMPICTVTDV